MTETIKIYDWTYNGMEVSPNGEWVLLKDVFSPEVIALIKGEQK